MMGKTYSYTGQEGCDIRVIEWCINTSAITQKDFGWALLADLLSLEFPQELSVQDKATLDAIVADTGHLDHYKFARCETIDDRTEELCLAGFHYVNAAIPADVWFSTSEHAQANWTGLKALVDTMKSAGIPDEQIFPMKMPTKPLAGGNWLCPSYAVYVDVCIKMGLRRGDVVTSGQDLKDAVNNATTKAAVDAIVDDRT
jgi:hypothetical protein